ncbi:helix-turn-helix domain-containing protein [Streptomyces bingchenggensis BCW-1]|uniref:Helix-turn-helix domain-containing protein n=1 Tax=Streptomyces bingchenggensis (strain BCW-1) TaxID=749414 RepID=D7C3C1_STRBB|nr:helix-turn-helix transcriptional regulator [Streptomyces bingchenggensis]ADI10146.1 helix-turn-helix domain-containing protein [Streptomyces bingchenggensis BCW-1]
MPPKRQIPTVRLRRLAAELRRLRSESELTREEVTGQTGINEATLYRIETARVRPQRRTLVALLDLYHVRDPQRGEVLALLQGANTRGWLRPYHSELPEEYTAYISFENEAWEVRNYESLFIPGLLQTEDYARAVIRGTLPMASAEAVEQRVQARIERKAVLAKDDPLRVWAIMDEAALRRMVGGPKAMREQMKHLAQEAEKPHVTLQVIPFSAGAHADMPGSFVLMGFADAEDPEIVYLDSMAGDLFLEAEIDVRRYGVMFDNLRAQALSPDSTLSLITTLISEMQ